MAVTKPLECLRGNKMKKLILFLLLAWPLSIQAQQITITGNILDPASAPYGNASMSIDLTVPANAPQQPTIGGSVFQQHFVTNLNSAGFFSATIFDNNQISDGLTPSGTQWRFTICMPNNPTYHGLPCFNSTQTITGSSPQNIGATLSASAVLLPNSTSSAITATALRIVTNTVPAANVFVKPLPADAVQYVCADLTCSDSNDGLSWGSGVADVATAYSNLPSCSNPQWYQFGSYTSVSWTHCGKIYVGAGSFTTTNVTVASPEVAIWGLSPQATRLNCTPTSGACLEYSVGSSNNSMDTNGSSGVYNLTIDGYNASAGTYGLETNDISSFQAQNVQIQNFTGSGSVCWYDTATASYNEKQDVDIRTNNCTTAWEVNPGSGSQGYPNTTFGYGRHKIACLVWGSQNCFMMTNGELENDFLQLTVNLGTTTATGMALTGAANISNNNINIHIEGQASASGAEISLASGTTFYNNAGQFNQDQANTNSINAASTFYPIGYETSIYGIIGATLPGRISTWDMYAPSSTNINVGDWNIFNYRSSTNTSEEVTGKLFYGNQLGAGTLGTLSAAAFQLSVGNGSGAISNGKGIHVLSPSVTGTGSISANYGVEVDAQSGNNISQSVGFAQFGSSDLNIFAGQSEFTLTSNQLVIGTTHTDTLNFSAPAASRTLTIPDAGGAANFAFASIADCGTSASCASPTKPTTPLIYTVGHPSMSSGTSVTVSPLPNSYTSATSFGCTAADPTHPAYTWQVTNNSATSITITSGTSNSDAWTFSCTGY